MDRLPSLEPIETFRRPLSTYAKTVQREGMQPKDNMDAVGEFPGDGMVVVCDGVGGQIQSETASRSVIDLLESRAENL